MKVGIEVRKSDLIDHAFAVSFYAQLTYSFYFLL